MDVQISNAKLHFKINDNVFVLFAEEFLNWWFICRINAYLGKYMLNLWSNIPAPSTYGIYISQLVRYSEACAQHSDFLTELSCWLKATQTRVRCSYVEVYSRHNELVDRYEISISQMAINLFRYI